MAKKPFLKGTVTSKYLLCNLNQTTQLIPFLYLNWSFSPLKTFERLSVEEENVRFERAIRTNHVVVILTSICNIVISSNSKVFAISRVRLHWVSSCKHVMSSGKGTSNSRLPSNQIRTSFINASIEM